MCLSCKNMDTLVNDICCCVKERLLPAFWVHSQAWSYDHILCEKIHALIQLHGVCKHFHSFCWCISFIEDSCGRYMLLLVYIVYWRLHWMIHVVGVLSCNIEMCKPRLLQTSTWRLKLWPHSTWKEIAETAHHVDCINFWILKSAKSWDDCWLLVVIIAEQFF